MDLSLLPCEKLSGVGKRSAEKLARLGIHYVQDVLFHLPFRYQDRTVISNIMEITPGEHAVVEGVVESITTPQHGRTKLFVALRDTTGRFHLRFFYVNALQKNTLQPGTRVRCFGEARLGTHGLEMIHPEYRIISTEKELPIEENLTPIYSTTEGVTQNALRKLTDQALQLLQNGGMLHEILPEKILQRFAFPDLKKALHYVHRPPKNAPVELLLTGKHDAQKRLVFEELLAHRLSLLQLKKNFKIHNAIPFKNKNQLMQTFFKTLPFELTQAQKRVIDEIDHDLQQPHPMLRLVQGDVGSGKTVVAAFAILRAIENNLQAVVLAPTELLAEQHFNTFKHWLSPLNVPVYFLTGQMKAAERRKTLQAITTGETAVFIGTHALFQKNVHFAKLALIVVDEQHRFGVEQRALLREKGIHEKNYPHQLVMTATPIPRTLAMSVYADLDYSVIDELPPGRTPITTKVIPSSRRDEVLERIRASCLAGKQAYWVCTLIEESENLQCQAAENTARALQEFLSEIKVGLIHGRMKSQEKEAIMAAFKKNEIQLLVATTVIEVGVDVPNASLMVIENAERLGLAQLHQLRGRVGRGSVASHCVLLYQYPLSDFAKKRLAVMRETTDGFKVAEKDLELRGPGEVMGTRQTGEVTLRIADLIRDGELLTSVQQAATIIQNEYPELLDPLIRRWIGNKNKFAHV